MALKINSISLINQLYKTFLNHDHIFQNQTLILKAEYVFSYSSRFAPTASSDANFMFLYSALNEICNNYWHFYFFLLKNKLNELNK